MFRDSSQRHLRIAYGHTLGFGAIVSITAAIIAIGPVNKVAFAEFDELEPSFEEVKKVEDISFTAPPRTIKDITAILDQEKPNLEKIKSLQKKVEAEPPPDLAGEDLASFYYERGLAAAELGRINQQLSDFKRAIELGREHIGNIPRYYQQLAYAERDAGNLKAAAAAMKKRLEKASKGQYFSGYRFLASVAAAFGENPAFHHVYAAGFGHQVIAVFQQAVSQRVGNTPVATEFHPVKFDQPMFEPIRQFSLP